MKFLMAGFTIQKLFSKGNYVFLEIILYFFPGTLLEKGSIELFQT